MKRLACATLLATAAMIGNAADINIDIGQARVEAPGVTVTFGTRDSRGWYWDGNDYRDPDYWRRHNGPKGPKYYTGGGKGNGGCPPGQAKKGNCR